LQEISQDQAREWIVTLESGKTVSALDIQEQYLEAAQRHCKGQDEETDWVLEQWEQVLRDLKGDYTTLVGRVDWASKLWLLETYREAERVGWDDPMLKSLDLEYHNLNAGRGLYFGLLEEGKVPRSSWPRTGRPAIPAPSAGLKSCAICLPAGRRPNRTINRCATASIRPTSSTGLHSNCAGATPS
jgi:hypothetical protein